MNIRFIALVATATLLSTSSGCSGMRNFLFGQGARCGLCQKLTAPFTPAAPEYAPQAPCGTTPYAPAGPTCSQPVVSAPNRGFLGFGGQTLHGSAYADQCECGQHGGVVNDPYLSSGSGIPYQGTVMGEQIIGGNVYPNTVYPNSGAPMQGDNFQSRRIDNDGNQILWEEPLPPGVVAQ